MLTTTIDGTEYPLATTLRVAYMVQGENNHKPYSQVFSDLGDMPIESQIGILYCAFKVANPNVLMTKQRFLDYYLDNMNIKKIMEQLKVLIQAITGVGDDEIAATTEAADTQVPEGN